MKKYRITKYPPDNRDAEMEISFGWDYYMYITTEHISGKTIRLLEKTGIYVEEMI